MVRYSYYYLYNFYQLHCNTILLHMHLCRLYSMTMGMKFLVLCVANHAMLPITFKKKENGKERSLGTKNLLTYKQLQARFACWK